MPILTRPEVLARQPPGGTPINRAHPYAKGLIHAWNLNGSARDLVGDWHGSLVGSAAYATGKPGRGVSLPAGYSDRIDTATLGATGTASFCQITHCYIDNPAQVQLIGCASDGFGNEGYLLAWGADGNWYTIDHFSSYTYVAGSLNAGWNTIAVNFDYASNLFDVYVRGLPKVSAAAGAVSSSFYVRHLFGSSGGSFGLPNGVGVLNLLFDGAQPESKIKALMDNPWQIFAA